MPTRPQCCSAWGWCSDPTTQDQTAFCQQQDQKTFYSLIGPNLLTCSTNADCQALNANAQCVQTQVQNYGWAYYGSCSLPADPTTFQGTSAPNAQQQAGAPGQNAAARTTSPVRLGDVPTPAPAKSGTSSVTVAVSFLAVVVGALFYLN